MPHNGLSDLQWAAGKVRSRPNPASGGFVVELPVYFVSRRSLEVVEKDRIRCQRSLQDFYQRREQDCSRPAAFKNATLRQRPTAFVDQRPLLSSPINYRCCRASTAPSAFMQTLVSIRIG